MQLTFLSAAVPLSKAIAYSKGDDAYTTTAYPMIRRVTSHTAEVHSIEEFRTTLLEQGAAGRALLFGGLKRPLVKESRAGMADNSPHTWVCFDFDKVDYPISYEGVCDALMDSLPQYVLDADLFVQLSPSCYSPHATRLSFHAFAFVEEAIPTKRLKEWLTHLNFSSSYLSEHIELTASGAALSFKLDRCVADSSRLIYIAPPRCAGFEPSLDKAEWLIKGERRAIAIPPNFTYDRDIENERLRKLRDEAGYDNAKFRTRSIAGDIVLAESPAGFITDIKPSGNKFIRFNLNGGDSQAYWIDLERPHLIGNFKGEPFMLTEQVDKALYRQLAKAVKAQAPTASTADGVEPLAFYATNQGSMIYIGTYNRGKDELRVEPSNHAAAASWMTMHGVVTQGMLPHYDLVYDVSSNLRYEEGFPMINLYQQTKFIKQFGDIERTLPFDKSVEQLAAKCPVINAMLDSILAGNVRAKRMFLNWLAFIFQNRTKAGTAWLLWGVEGSGKGLLLDKVLKSLFGEENTAQMMFNNLDGDFNSMLSGKLLVNIDEAELSKSRDGDEVMAKLRNWITEPMMVINTKHVRERSEPSFVNFIVFANSFRPIRISASDRRWHVAPRQEARWYPTPNQIAVLEQGEELPDFAQLLGMLVVDEDLVRRPDDNAERERLFESTHSLIDLCATAITKGDSNFFFDARPSDAVVAATKGSENLPLAEYDDLLRAIRAGTFNVLTFEDLYIMFRVVTYEARGFPESQTKQKSLFRRFGLAPQPRPLKCNRREVEVYGVPAPKWDDVKERFDEIAPLRTSDNVRHIKAR